MKHELNKSQECVMILFIIFFSFFYFLLLLCLERVRLGDTQRID